MSMAQTSHSNCSAIDTEYILVTKSIYCFFFSLVLFGTYTATVFLHLATGHLSEIV